MQEMQLDPEQKKKSTELPAEQQSEPKQKQPNRPPLTLAAIHVARSLSQEIRSAPDAAAGEVLSDHVKALNMLAELRQKYCAGESLEDAET